MKSILSGWCSERGRDWSVGGCNERIGHRGGGKNNERTKRKKRTLNSPRMPSLLISINNCNLPATVPQLSFEVDSVSRIFKQESDDQMKEWVHRVKEKDGEIKWENIRYCNSNE